MLSFIILLFLIVVIEKRKFADGGWSSNPAIYRGINGSTLLGKSLAISDDASLLLVGAPSYNSESGTMFLFYLLTGSFVPEWSLIANIEETMSLLSSDNYGSSVAMSGDGRFVAGGAPNYDTGTGYVDIFEQGNYLDEWNRRGVRLVGFNQYSFFGTSIAFDSTGDIIAVGAPSQDLSTFDSLFIGVYIYAFDYTTYEYVPMGTTLSRGYQLFGKSLDLSADGKTIVVGAPKYATGDPINYRYFGAVCVFQYNDALLNWDLKGGNCIFGDNENGNLGRSVAINDRGNMIFVGQPSDDYEGKLFVYKYDKVSDAWSLRQALYDTALAFNQDTLGESLSVTSTGEYIIVSGSLAGFALFYHWDPFTESVISSLQVFGPVYGSTFGTAVAVSNVPYQWVVGDPTAYSAVSMALAGYIYSTEYSFTTSVPTQAPSMNVPSFSSKSWILKGDVIEGSGFCSHFGIGLDMDGNGSALIIGASAKQGCVIYATYDSVVAMWATMPLFIGTSNFESCGSGVAMTRDGSMIAVGCPGVNTFATPSIENGGGVYVLTQDAANPSIWNDFNIDNPNAPFIEGSSSNESFGSFIILADDGQSMAIGAPYRAYYSNVKAGAVDIFVHDHDNDIIYPQGKWIKQDSIMIQEENAQFSDLTRVHFIAMNDDAKIIAISGVFANNTYGCVQVYQRDVSLWTKYGSALIGARPSENFGMALALNSVGDLLAVSSLTGNSHGSVVIYQYSSFSHDWTQLGNILNGTVPHGVFGANLAFNRAGNVLAVTSLTSDGTKEDGQVQIFGFDPISILWDQLGQTLNGSTSSSFGSRMVLNDEGSTIAISAPYDGFGKVYVYSLRGERSPTSQPSSQPTQQPTTAPSLEMSLNSTLDTWLQYGSTLSDSTGALGFSIALTPDGSIMVVSNIGYSSYAGKVIIYTRSSGSWFLFQQITSPFGSNTQFGYGLAISDDSNVLAVGALTASVTFQSAGAVVIYRRSSTSSPFVQNVTFDGETANDNFGACVSLSSDGNIIAIGAPYYGSAGLLKRSAVYIKAYQQGRWVSLGSSILGSSSNTQWQSGVRHKFLSMSGDGFTVMIGYITYNKALVYRYQASNNTWVKKGGTFTMSSVLGGDNIGNLGYVVAVSQEGNVIALAGTSGLSSVASGGFVAVYRYDATLNAWIQMGSTFFGRRVNDLLGFDLKLNRDGTVVMISGLAGPLSDNAGSYAVYAYQRHTSKWIMVGSEGCGTISGQKLGIMIAMTPDAKTIAATSIFSTGYVKVYDYIYSPSSQPTNQPSRQPTRQPTSQPSSQPMVLPTSSPSMEVMLNTAGNSLQQHGSSLYGSYTNEQYGRAVALSADGLTMATSSVDGYGKVDVYGFENGDWSRLDEIVGERDYYSLFGYSLAMSDDASILAVAAPNASYDSAINVGIVEVFIYNTSSYERFGSVMYGTTRGGYFGQDIAISTDGHTVAVLEPYSSSAGFTKNGAFYVYKYVSGSWVLKGDKIVGSGSESFFVVSTSPQQECVSLSGDGSRLAISFPRYSGTMTNTGKVAVYQYQNSKWIQIGQNMSAEIVNSYFGRSVAISRSGNVIAASGNYFSITDALFIGIVRVYRYDATANVWVLKGSMISGSQFKDYMCINIVLNIDGTVLFVSGLGVSSLGYVSLFVFSSYLQTWESVGQRIYGSGVNERFGFPTSMNSDGTILATSAILHSSNNYTKNGVVQVFQLVTTPSSQPSGQPSTQPSFQPSSSPTLELAMQFSANSYQQVGNTLFGSEASASYGLGLAMSADGLTIAASSYTYNFDSGRVDIFSFLHQQWVRFAQIFGGHGQGSDFGWCVSISFDGSILAASGPLFDNNRGLVEIFQYNGSAYTRRGNLLYGEAIGHYFGNCIALNSNGEYVVVSAPLYSSLTVNYVCAAYVYQYIAGSYIQLGDALTGVTAVGTLSLQFLNRQMNVDISDSGSTVIFGIPRHKVLDAEVGVFSVYDYDSNENKWFQRGQNITGLVTGSLLGRATVINGDGNVVAVAMNRYSSDFPSLIGNVFTFRYDYGTSMWIQLGQVLNGTMQKEVFGLNLDLNRDGTILVVSSKDTFYSAANIGHISIYVYRTSDDYWELVGSRIYGDATEDIFGYKVAINAAGTMVAASSIYSSAFATNAGFVKVYELVTLPTSQPSSQPTTNPTTELVGQVANKNFMQLGSSIVGNNVGDELGAALALSADGMMLVTSSVAYLQGAGRVDVYTYSSVLHEWQLFLQLPGTYGNGSLFGTAVALSDDGSVLVVGAPFATYQSNPARTGVVNLYRIIDGGCVLSAMFVGEAYGDAFGKDLALTGDGTYLAVLSPYFDSPGHVDDSAVYVYSYNSEVESWERVGNKIIGSQSNIMLLASSSLRHHAIGIAEDGQTLVVGYPRKTILASRPFAGMVSIFRYSSSSASWEQIGQNITGVIALAIFGVIVAINGDGNAISVGSVRYSNAYPTGSGNIISYRYNANTNMWEQLGQILNGTSSNDFFCSALAMNRDGSLIVASGAGVQHYNSGYFAVFAYVDSISKWNLINDRVYGDFSSDYMGSRLAMNADGNIIAASSTLSASSTGYIKIFQIVNSPTYAPTSFPSSQPSQQPSNQPSSKPTRQPSTQPSSSPTTTPSSDIFRWKNDKTWYRYQDIIGTSYRESLGVSVSLSANGNIIAVGSPHYSNNRGRVSVYQCATIGCFSVGQTLSGSGIGYYFGFSVSLSSDGLFLAIGSPGGGSLNKGTISIYCFSSGTWNLAAATTGLGNNDMQGTAVQIAGSGTALYMLAPFYDTSYPNTGRFVKFAITCSSVVVTLTMSPPSNLGDLFVFWNQTSEAFSVSENQKTVVIGYPYLQSTVVKGGCVRFRRFDNTAVISTVTYYGNVVNGLYGVNVAVSGNGLYVAAREYYNYEARVSRVYTYKLSEESWELLPGVLVGGTDDIDFGMSMKFNYDGTLFCASSNRVIGASLLGVVYCYTLDFGKQEWYEVADPIVSDTYNDGFGSKISLDSSGTMLAISSPYHNEGSDLGVGGVKLYQLLFTPTSQPSSQPSSSPTSFPTNELVLGHSDKFWYQNGQPIFGNLGEQVGFVTLLSGDSKTLIVSSWSLYSFTSAYVRCFYWSQFQEDWIEEAYLAPSFANLGISFYGYSVAINYNGTILAVGAPDSVGNGIIFLYVKQLGEWLNIIQLFPTESNYYFAMSMCFNDDGNQLLVHSATHESGIGKIEMYSLYFDYDYWISTRFNFSSQIPILDIYSARISNIATDASIKRIAIGSANYSSAYGSFIGRVAIFEYSSNLNNFISMSYLEGLNAGNYFGTTVAMSSSGNVVAAASKFFNNSAIYEGYVLVYQYRLPTSSWHRLGQKLEIPILEETYGVSLSLSADGMILAIGGDQGYKGKVRIYTFDRSTYLWVQIGWDIEGTQQGGCFGKNIALSRNGRRLVVAANCEDFFSGNVYTYGLSYAPSANPTVVPTMSPTTYSPSSEPSNQPSSQPSRQPIIAPTSQPSSQPSSQPTKQPSSRPSSQPSDQPSMQPSRQPTTGPSAQPSTKPTTQPTFQPSRHPSSQPSVSPTTQPARRPTSQPTNQPSQQPMSRPSSLPTMQPSYHPTRQPSRQPSSHPTSQPSAQPSIFPIAQPSSQPSMQPFRHPTVSPSAQPTFQPSKQPSKQPSSQPSRNPTAYPSSQPSYSPVSFPTSQPSNQPSVQPTGLPTNEPSLQPSAIPSTQPSSPPSGLPSEFPSGKPTSQPTSIPSTIPSTIPTTQPSSQPINQPTCQPSNQPSNQPSAQPSSPPSFHPTCQPSLIPTSQPSSQPQTVPTMIPSSLPSSSPTTQPSISPTSQPTIVPTLFPSSHPSIQPTMIPSIQPISYPSANPSSQPSSDPSGQPSCQPTHSPTKKTSTPTYFPTLSPTSHPTPVSVNGKSSLSLSIKSNSYLLDASLWTNTSILSKFVHCDEVFLLNDELYYCRWVPTRRVYFALSKWRGLDLLQITYVTNKQFGTNVTRNLPVNSFKHNTLPAALVYCPSNTDHHCSVSFEYKNTSIDSTSERWMNMSIASVLLLKDFLPSNVRMTEVLSNTDCFVFCDFHHHCACSRVNDVSHTIVGSASYVVQIRRHGMAAETFLHYAHQELVLRIAVVKVDINATGVRNWQYSLGILDVTSNRTYSVTAMDSSVLRIARRSLVSGHHYTFAVYVTDRTSNMTLTKHVNVSCEHAPLQLFRSPLSNQVQVAVDQELQLNSKLLDNNVYSSITVTNVSFWCNISTVCTVEDIEVDCTYVKVNVTQRWVGSDREVTNSSTYTALFSVTSSKVQKLSLCIYMDYLLPGASEKKQIVDKISLDVVSVPVPLVYSTASFAAWQQQVSLPFSLSKPVELVSLRAVEVNASCSYKMTYPFTTSSKVISIATGRSSSISSLSLSNMMTSVQKQTLLPSASLLIFRFDCLASSYATSFEIDVYFNSPPYGGDVHVLPTAGVSWQTPFSLSAAGWTDDKSDDFPLSYTFSFHLVSASLSTSAWPLVGYDMEPTMDNVLLPAAVVAASSLHSNATTALYQTFDIQVTVSDVWGARRSASCNVSVRDSHVHGMDDYSSAAYWTQLKTFLSSNRTFEVSDEAHLFGDQQRSAVVLYTISSILSAVASQPSSSASTSTTAMIYQHADQLLDVVVNVTSSEGANSEIIRGLLTEANVLSIYTDLQVQRQAVVSMLGPSFANISQMAQRLTNNTNFLNVSIGAEINSALARQVIGTVQQVVDALGVNMVNLLQAYFSSANNNAAMSTIFTKAGTSSSGTVSSNGTLVVSPIVLQTLSLLTELVTLTIAVVSLPNNSGTSYAPVVAGNNQNNNSTNIVTIQPPALHIGQTHGIVGMVVSVTELSPELLSPTGFIKVVNKTNLHVDSTSAVVYGSSEYLEQPKLASDVVTINVMYASNQSSLASSPLPVFQVNLTMRDDAVTLASSAALAANTRLDHNCSNNGVVEHISLQCPVSYVWLNLTCFGERAVHVRRQCPVPKTVCSVLDLANSKVVSNDYCEAQVSPATGSVTCKCGMDVSQGSGDSNNATLTGILALKGKISVAAFSSFAAGELDSSVVSVVSVGLAGGSNADQSTIILATFACIWGIGFLLMGYHYMRWSQEVDNAKKNCLVKNKDGVSAGWILSVSSWFASSDIFPKTNKVRQTDTDHMPQVAPTLQQQQQAMFLQYLLSFQALMYAHPGWTWYRRFWHALCDNHTYLQVLFTAPHTLGPHPQQDISRVSQTSLSHTRKTPAQQSALEEEQKRVLWNIVQLLTALTMSCFVLAVLYDLQYPVEDGYCGQFNYQANSVTNNKNNNKETCEYRKTLLDPWQSRCTWVGPTPSSSSSSTSTAPAMITEVLYGAIMRKITVTPTSGSDSEKQETSDCILNESNNSLIAFIFSFVITSLFGAVFSGILSVVFNVLRDMSLDGTQSESYSNTPSNTSLSEHSLEVYKMPDAVTQARQRVMIAASLQDRHNHTTMDPLDHDDYFNHSKDNSKNTDVRVAESISNCNKMSHNNMDGADRGVLLLQHYIASLLDTSDAEDNHSELFVRTWHRHFADTLHIPRTTNKPIDRDLTTHNRYALIRYVFCVLFVLSLNAGALFFIVSKSILRGHDWQWAYLRVCVWEWVTETCVLQVVDILILDCWLPGLVLQEVYVVFVRCVQLFSMFVQHKPALCDKENVHPSTTVSSARKSKTVVRELTQRYAMLWEARFILYCDTCVTTQKLDNHTYSKSQSPVQTSHVSRDIALNTNNTAGEKVKRLLLRLPGGVLYGGLRISTLILITFVIYLWFTYLWPNMKRHSSLTGETVLLIVVVCILLVLWLQYIDVFKSFKMCITMQKTLPTHAMHTPHQLTAAEAQLMHLLVFSSNNIAMDKLEKVLEVAEEADGEEEESSQQSYSYLDSETSSFLPDHVLLTFSDNSGSFSSHGSTFVAFSSDRSSNSSHSSETDATSDTFVSFQGHESDEEDEDDFDHDADMRITKNNKGYVPHGSESKESDSSHGHSLPSSPLHSFVSNSSSLKSWSSFESDSC